MLPKYRFLFFNVVIGLAACVLFLSFVGNKPGIVYASPANQSSADGDVARGKYLVTIAACVDCHGNFKMASEKGVPLSGGTEFNLGPVGTFYAANLTTLQDWKTEDFLKVFHEGLDPKSKRVLAPIMPYISYHGMSDSDVASVGAYLRSLTPVKNDVPAAKPGAIAAIAFRALPAVSVSDMKAADTADYGRYIVENISTCGDCHSPHDQQNAVLKGRDLSGGTLNLGSDQEPIYASPILGSVLTAEGYTKENFFVTLRTGVRPWGAKLPVQMPWRAFAQMTDNDITAVWNFLQTKKMDTPWPQPKGIPAAPTEGAPPVPTPAATAAK